MKLSRFATSLYAVLIFASGAVVGALSQRLYTVNAVSPPRPNSPEEFRKKYLAEMQSRLSLRPEQITELNKILDDTHKRFSEARERQRPEMEKIRQDQTARVRQILDPGQISEYEKFLADRAKKMPNGQSPPGPPPSGK
jgi:hypothetical protein